MGPADSSDPQRAVVPRTSQELGTWLRGLRERADLTQDELALALQTSRRNIHRWESDGHQPGALMLLRLLSALGVEVGGGLPGAPRALTAELADVAAGVAGLQAFSRDRFRRIEHRLDDLQGRFEALEEEARVESVRRSVDDKPCAP